MECVNCGKETSVPGPCMRCEKLIGDAVLEKWGEAT